MDLRNLFSKISFDSNSKKQPTKKDAPSHWVKCPECNALMFFKEVENQDNICPKCNFHMRIGAKRRIEILTDKDSFVEFDVELKPNDPLKFVDKTSYKKKNLEKTYHKQWCKCNICSFEKIKKYYKKKKKTIKNCIWLNE